MTRDDIMFKLFEDHEGIFITRFTSSKRCTHELDSKMYRAYETFDGKWSPINEAIQELDLVDKTVTRRA